MHDSPGEDLPPFPRPTHELGDVSIRQTLEEIEAIHGVSPLAHHNPEILRGQVRREPYDPYCLAKTITCKGGENYHPSGERQFTVREILALQTFPHSFKFPETIDGKVFTTTEMKVQAGNAVPPCFGRTILESVIKSLKAYDQRRLAVFRGGSLSDAIEL